MNKMMFLGSLVAIAIALAPNAMALTTPAQSEPPPEVTQFKFFQYPADVPGAIISYLGTHTLPNGGKCAAGLTPTVAAPKDAWRGLKGNPPQAMRNQMSFDAERCRKVAPDNWDGSCGYLPDGIIAAGVMLCLSNDLVLATNGQIRTLNMRVDIAIGKADAAQRTADRAEQKADAASADAKDAKDGVDGLNDRQTATEATVTGQGERIMSLENQPAGRVRLHITAFGNVGSFASGAGIGAALKLRLSKGWSAKLGGGLGWAYEMPGQNGHRNGFGWNADLLAQFAPRHFLTFGIGPAAIGDAGDFMGTRSFGLGAKFEATFWINRILGVSVAAFGGAGMHSAKWSQWQPVGAGTVSLTVSPWGEW